MATVYPFPPKAKEREAETTTYVGMVLFLASWAILFAGLFFAYALLRVKSTHWPPEDVPHLPLALPGAASAVLFLSSVALSSSLRSKAALRSQIFLCVALLLGACFIAMQCVTWLQLWDAGLQLDSGAYGGVFYTLTLFHALHVVGGLAVLFWLLPSAVRVGAPKVKALRPAALFWHFVDVVWLIMFLVVYVL